MNAQLVLLDTLQDAVVWREKNRAAYNAIVRWALEDQDHGARPSIKLYFELLRRPWMAEKLGLQRMSVSFLLNNNMHSQIARLVNRDHSNIHFPTRRSLTDSWDDRRLSSLIGKGP